MPAPTTAELPLKEGLALMLSLTSAGLVTEARITPSDEDLDRRIQEYTQAFLEGLWNNGYVIVPAMESGFDEIPY